MGEQFSVSVLLNAVIVLQMPAVIKSIHKQLSVQFLWDYKKTLCISYFLLSLFALRPAFASGHLILQSQTAGVLVASLEQLPTHQCLLGLIMKLHIIFLNGKISQRLFVSQFAGSGHTSHHPCYGCDYSWIPARVTIVCAWWPSCSPGSELQ